MLTLDAPIFATLGFLMLFLSALIYAFNIYNKCKARLRRQPEFHPVNGVGMRALLRPARAVDVAEAAEEEHHRVM